MPVVIGLADLGVLLALACLIGLSYSYRYTLGAVILSVANLLGSVRLPGLIGGGRVLGFAADALVKVDNEIRATLGRGITDMQAVWNESVSYTATAFHWIGKEIASVSHDTAQAIEGLHVSSVTNVYKKINPWVIHRLAALSAAVAALPHKLVHGAVTIVHKTYPVIKTIEHVVTHPDVSWLPKLLARVGALEAAIALPHPSTIPIAIPKIGPLTREVADLYRRVKELARRGAPAVALGALIAALARLGIKWIRCAKVARTGKRVCAMNDDLLDSLLADTLLVVGSISVVAFAKELQTIETATVVAMRRFVKEI
ncbi:MAG TPA: hypothetical protein VH279_07290 [Solirubrobacteraceae bacterium]|jgi:hypothetical protein|nr:hypothetical protein [Solirubrobacteraceae bacterium]